MKQITSKLMETITDYRFYVPLTVCFFVLVLAALIKWIVPVYDCTFHAVVNDERVVCHDKASFDGTVILNECENGATYYAVQNVKAVCVKR